MTTLDQHIDEYIKYLQQDGKAANTIKAYKEVFKLLIRENPEFNKKSIAIFWNLFYATKNSSVKCVSYAALNGLFEWLLIDEIIPVNPLLSKSIPVPTPKKSRPKPIPDREYQTIQRKVLGLSIQLKTAFALLSETGMRAGELLSLNVDSCLFTSKGIDINFIGKGGVNRFAFIDARTEMYKLLRDYIKAENLLSGPLFSSNQGKRMSYSMLRKHWIEKVSPTFNMHRLRHTIFTDMASNDVPIEIIQESAGHANINTSRIYIEISKERFKNKISGYQIERGRNAAILQGR